MKNKIRKILLGILLLTLSFGLMYMPVKADSGWDSDYDSGGWDSDWGPASGRHCYYCRYCSYRSDPGFDPDSVAAVADFAAA